MHSNVMIVIVAAFLTTQILSHTLYNGQQNINKRMHRMLLQELEGNSTDAVNSTPTNDDHILEESPPPPPPFSSPYMSLTEISNTINNNINNTQNEDNVEPVQETNALINNQVSIGQQLSNQQQYVPSMFLPVSNPPEELQQIPIQEQNKTQPVIKEVLRLDKDNTTQVAQGIQAIQSFAFVQINSSPQPINSVINDQNMLLFPVTTDVPDQNKSPDWFVNFINTLPQEVQYEPPVLSISLSPPPPPTFTTTISTMSLSQCPSQEIAAAACPYQADLDFNQNQLQQRVRSLYTDLLQSCTLYDIGDLQRSFLITTNEQTDCCQKLLQYDSELLKNCQCNSNFKCQSEFGLIGSSQGQGLDSVFEYCNMQKYQNVPSCS